VLIADDHVLARGGLRSILGTDAEIEVVGEAENGAEAVDRCADLRPDVVLLDLRMPEVDGIQAIPRLRERCPETRILVVTMHDDQTTHEQALAAGADRVLHKDESARVLLDTVRSLSRRDAAGR
jgi:DNA-binding NarL/FixJ family response regulator